MENILVKTLGFAIITGIITGLIGFVGVVRAQQQGAIQINNPLRYNTIQEIIERIAEYLWYIAWLVAPLLVIIGAFYIITAGGSQQRAAQGRRIIIYAIVGLLIVLLARGVIGLVNAILGIP